MSRALGCVELQSLARGVRVLDVMVKRAPVTVRHHGRHSTGKYVILIEGAVADVEESYEDALQHCGDTLLDHMFLPLAHDRVWSALDGEYAPADERAALMVETSTLACCIESMDFAIKLVDASVADLQLGNGIGGKGYYVLQAEQYDLEYARDELLIRLPAERLVGIDLIANPHPEMLCALTHAGPFDR